MAYPNENPIHSEFVYTAFQTAPRVTSRTTLMCLFSLLSKTSKVVTTTMVETSRFEMTQHEDCWTRRSRRRIPRSLTNSGSLRWTCLLLLSTTVSALDPNGLPAAGTTSSSLKDVTGAEKSFVPKKTDGNMIDDDQILAVAAVNKETPSSSLTRPRRKKKKKKQGSAHAASSSSSVRRLYAEYKQAVQAGICFDWLSGKPVRTNDPSHIWIGPVDSTLRIWHFTVAGLPGSPYQSGLYHGRLLLDKEYPATPPRVQMWTASARFAVGTDICLSASSYHPETWQPDKWNVRTVVESLRLHMLTAAHEIGGLNRDVAERRRMATASRRFGMQFTNRQGHAVRIDHARMLNEGWIEGAKPDEEEEPRVTCTREDELVETLSGMAIDTSLRDRLRGAFIRLSLVSFVVLFFLLNRS